MKKCIIFNCDKKRANVCCFYCEQKNRCKNHCLNDPKKCRQLETEDTNDTEID